MNDFDKIMLNILAARGVTVGADGAFRRIEGFEGPERATDAQIRILNERTPKADLNGRLRRYWVNELVDVAALVSAEGLRAPWYARSIFWIRLHGVLDDIRSAALAGMKLVGIDPNTANAPPGSILSMQLELVAAIEGLRSQFSEDEMIYADYLRQCNGHPNQDAYGARWSKKNGGQVIDRRTVPTIGKEYTAAELEAAIERVLVANAVNGQVNEDAIAATFARRVVAVSAPLMAIMLRLTTPS